MMMELNISYIDRGYISVDNKFTWVHEKTCICCREDRGRGFDIKNDNPMNPIFHQGARGNIIGFVCVDCIYDFLKKEGYELNSSQDIFKINFSLPKKYAQIHLRYKQGKFPAKDYLEQKEEFRKVMPDILMEAIEYLTSLDLDYSENIHKGTEWQGWWMGLTGEEVKIFFSWLQNGIVYQYDNMIDEFKKEFRTNKVTPAIYTADMVYKQVK